MSIRIYLLQFLLQNLICRLVVAILGFCGSAPAEKLNWRLIKVWILVNAIFVGMLVSGMYRDVIKLPNFCAVATASGLPGLAISFISVVFISNWPHNLQSGAFIDKIPISTAGLVLLKFPLSLPNLFRHISYLGHLIKIWEVICS
ncbi:GDP-mannose transporter GONST2 isoform X1 [Manihot esculenta]|uniref:GDP-mannose transporter GONST2 isoform X1 n=1 Tax=Manihot esculenta TaxID=3983 RepID=UPI000B5D27AD|nr:GDP-mannose transporter GONST2 isoform X1 [Manihot esculenta]